MSDKWHVNFDLNLSKHVLPHVCWMIIAYTRPVTVVQMILSAQSLGFAGEEINAWHLPLHRMSFFSSPSSLWVSITPPSVWWQHTPAMTLGWWTGPSNTLLPLHPTKGSLGSSGARQYNPDQTLCLGTHCSRTCSGSLFLCSAMKFTWYRRSRS